MTVDDNTFNDFVNNSLPRERMTAVEAQLRADGEADSALAAAVLNFDLNMARAPEILGDDFFSPEKDRSVGEAVSKEANNPETTLKSIAMNNQFTPEELQAVQAIVNDFNATRPEGTALRESLVRYYLTSRPGTSPEDGAAVVDAVAAGIKSFNDGLRQALEQGQYDYAARLREIGAGMPIKDRYELYINFLAALQTMEMSNLTSEQFSEIQDFNEIKTRLSVPGEVSEEMMAEAEEKIAALLRENTFCMGSLESLKELVEALPQGEAAVTGRILGSEADLRDKMIASVAAYIAYKDDRLPSLTGQEISPEAMAVTVSAGVAQAQVIEDLAAGRTTVDRAIHILKIIGGVALVCLLAVAALAGLVYVGVAVETALLMLGSAPFLAVLGSVAAIWWLSGYAVRAVGEITAFSGRMFDMVTGTWRRRVWPALKNVLATTAAWFAQLFARKTVVQAADAGTVQTA